MNRVIELTEYRRKQFNSEDLSEDLVQRLFQKYSDQLSIDPPSIFNENKWGLTPQGWVGYIPMDNESGILLKPKVSLHNIFQMMVYAYNLKSFHFLEGVMHCESMHDFYDELARILCRRITARCRKGLYRCYIAREDNLQYIRGRMDMTRWIRQPVRSRFDCRFEEHQADNADNQILTWTLNTILRTRMCSPKVLKSVRKAFRWLHGAVSLEPMKASDCMNRDYNRLNDDYRTLHTLCRFFLEHSSASHHLGSHDFLPFLVNMGRLYELFIARWLKQHIPTELEVIDQDKFTLASSNYYIDIVIRHRETGEHLCVLDSKYKVPDRASREDISQVLLYAEARHCRHAVLIYPRPLPNPIDEMVGNIRIRSMIFAIDRDIEGAGHEFLGKLMGMLGISQSKYEADL